MRLQLPTAIAFILSIVSVSVQAQEVGFSFKGNPLVTHTSAADPDAHVWEGKVWVFTSTDANLRDHGLGPPDSYTYAHMDGYRAFSTDDMVNWVDHGEVLHSRDVSWGPSGWMWAPSAAWNGKRGNDAMYYLYFPHKDWEGEWRIGVATAPSPIGPFTDIGTPIDGLIGIDPKVFTDKDGARYIFHNTASVAKLKPNMIELEEPSRLVDYGAKSMEKKFQFEEGSYMHRRGNMYYYSYSNWEARDTMAYYGIGKSPLGPFEWKGALAGKKSGSQDHHSIIRFKGKWYYFYHMDTPWDEKNKMEWYGQRRIMCYTRMYYNWDRSIRFVIPDYAYINAGGPRYDAVDDTTTYQWDLWYSANDSQVDGRGELIGNTGDSTLYQTYRYGDSFSYGVPLANGKYRVTFKFAEVNHDETGRRVFNVNAEDQMVIENLDVVAKVGKNVAYDETHTVSVNDNELNLVFTATIDKAMIAAIKVEKVQTFLDRLNIFA